MDWSWRSVFSRVCVIRNPTKLARKRLWWGLSVLVTLQVPILLQFLLCSSTKTAEYLETLIWNEDCDFSRKGLYHTCLIANSARFFRTALFTVFLDFFLLLSMQFFAIIPRSILRGSLPSQSRFFNNFNTQFTYKQYKYHLCQNSFFSSSCRRNLLKLPANKFIFQKPTIFLLKFCEIHSSEVLTSLILHLWAQNQVLKFRCF